METLAAREALERASSRPEDIDLLLVYSACPDYLAPTNAPRVHHALGLSRRCLTLGADAACNSFLTQLEVAAAMIASGACRKALIVQSVAFSRLLPIDLPHSAWFGDGATAAVVGKVSEGHGIIGRCHNTDGTNNRAIVIGVPGKHYTALGQTFIYPGELRDTANMVLSTVDRGKEAITAALAQAAVGPHQVEFFAGHQGMVWLREVIQAHAGLVNARAIDTFKGFANLSAANLPLILAMGERDGLLRPGQCVAAFSGGAGEVWSSMILRWGT
jgi:3-oxoacyl-[acyl-carrier-protein] synthase-3